MLFAWLCASACSGARDTSPSPAPIEGGENARRSGASGGAAGGSAHAAQHVEEVPDASIDAALRAEGDAAPPSDTCGKVCDSALDCAVDQICRDSLGVRECVPAKCGSCGGLCDYSRNPCKFVACYAGTTKSGGGDPCTCGSGGDDGP
jgi:hypothetical protein